MCRDWSRVILINWIVNVPPSNHLPVRTYVRTYVTPAIQLFNQSIYYTSTYTYPHAHARTHTHTHLRMPTPILAHTYYMYEHESGHSIWIWLCNVLVTVQKWIICTHRLYTDRLYTPTVHLSFVQTGCTPIVCKHRLYTFRLYRPTVHRSFVHSE